VKHQLAIAVAVLTGATGLLGGCAGRTPSGDVEGARRAYRQASVINRELGQQKAEAANHANLGMLAEGLQQYEEAAKEFAQALGITADLASMDRVAVRRGDMELGLEYMDRAYRSYAAQGDRMRALEVLSHAVEAARQSGRFDEAKRLEAESASLKAVPASR
jgi:tetratricopeptide (TPR) repeat protein